MKLLKLFSLAVAVGPMAMALLGASSATAESTALLASHVHEATSSAASLLTNIATIKCTVLFLGDILSAGLLGSPLIISGVFTYSGCNLGCSAEEKNGPSTIQVLKEGEHLAKVTGEGLVLVNCPALGLHCTYVGTNIVGHALDPLLAEGDTNGTTRIEGQTVVKDPKEELTFCPSTAKLDLLISPLTPTYISS